MLVSATGMVEVVEAIGSINVPDNGQTAHAELPLSIWKPCLSGHVPRSQGGNCYRREEQERPEEHSGTVALSMLAEGCTCGSPSFRT